MYFKKESLRYEKDLDLDDTFKFDELPETGKSAGLLITLASPLSGGQHYACTDFDDKIRMIDWFSKVQVIVDGKRPLKDLSGPVAQALSYWNTGKTVPDALKDRSIGEDRCFIPIAWGRRLYDPEYYLNWEDYASIELDLVNTMTDPPFDSATITIDNIKIMDEGALPASKGIFQERIWREFTTVQNKTEYFKLPIGNKLRRLILRCVPDLAAAAPFRRIRSFYHLAEEVKLALKGGDEICFEGYGEALMEQNILEFPHMPRTGGLTLGLTDGYGVRTGIGKRLAQSIAHSEIATSLTERNYGIYPYTDDIMCIFSDSSTNAYLTWQAMGLGYNNTLALLFDQLGIENLIDTDEKAPINLEIKTENHADAAAGVVEIILSELVPK